MKHRNLISLILFVFLVATNALNAFADIVRGIVVGKQQNEHFEIELLIKVNENDLRPYDHMLRLLTPNMPHSMGSMLNMIIENGASIVFEDGDMSITNNIKTGDQRRILSINNNHVLDIFPNSERDFYSAWWHDYYGSYIRYSRRNNSSSLPLPARIGLSSERLTAILPSKKGEKYDV